MLQRPLATIATGLFFLGSIFATGRAMAQAPDLPSPAGSTVAAIRAIAPGTWLDLGAPQPDSNWGRARGRTWTSKMAFSKALGGAFLFGEGVHGWVNPANGRYMDGLWLYDVNGHRWVSLHPGTDTRSPPALQVTRDGFVGLSSDRPIPIASMAHGYEMTAWDSVRQLFFSMPVHHGYYARALPGVVAFRQQNASALNRNAASPWMFDPWNRRWHRLRTRMGSPSSSYGHVLMFIPSNRKLLFYRPKQVFYYDPAKNAWHEVATGGPPPPFGIDPTACHDPGRDRLYIGGGSYPVAQGDNAFWVFEIKTERWLNPAPSGSPGGNEYGSNFAMMSCDSRKDRVYLFRHGGPGRGVYIYDAAKNAWRDRPVPLPGFWGKGRSANGFFHPGLGVQFIHVARDSQDDGRMIVYRPPE